MESAEVDADLTEVLLTEEQIRDRIAELCRMIEVDYEGREVLARRRAQRRRHGDGRPGARTAQGRRADGLDGGVVVRAEHEIERRGAHPERPRHRTHRSARADRRRHRGLGAHPVVASREPGESRTRHRSRSAPCCASRTRRGSRSTPSTWASRSPTSSSSATGSTTRSAIATCARSPFWRRTSTPEPAEMPRPSVVRRRRTLGNRQAAAR